MKSTRFVNDLLLKKNILSLYLNDLGYFNIFINCLIEKKQLISLENDLDYLNIMTRMDHLI